MLYFFINPASRSGKGARKWEQVKAFLECKKIPYEAHFLQARVSPRPIMEEIFAKEGNNPVSIVLIGGDGTVNQCLNGIPDFDRLLLSILPTGSGNDFCRNKAIPSSLEEQLDHIIHQTNRLEIDLGQITCSGTFPSENRYFLVSTGLGYDAEICHKANLSKLKKILNKVRLGKLVYLTIGIQSIFSAHLSDMDVTIDGTTTHYGNVFFVCAMNQPYEGGGVAMAPAASDTDGQLDFLIVHTISKFQALCTIPLLYIKKHIGRPGVTLISGKELSLSSSNQRVLHTDGECETGCQQLHAALAGKIQLIY